MYVCVYIYIYIYVHMHNAIILCRDDGNKAVMIIQRTDTVTLLANDITLFNVNNHMVLFVHLALMQTFNMVLLIHIISFNMSLSISLSLSIYVYIYIYIHIHIHIMVGGLAGRDGAFTVYFGIC